MMRKWITSVSALPVMLAPLTAPLAQPVEYCVTCSEPAAEYRCLPQLRDELRQALPSERVLRFACIKDIAKAYSHNQCSVRETKQVACGGEAIVLDLTKLAEDYARRIPGPVRRSLSGGNQPPQQPAEHARPKDGKDEPKTVVEMAKRAAETSEKQIKKAGKAVKDAGDYVGGTMQKTWRCISSLFSKC